MGDSSRGNGGIQGTDRLTDAACRAARPRKTGIHKLSDGKGMYLAVMPNGTKLWRLKYRHEGKEKIYSIGEYSEVSLADARKERDAARDWLRQGRDPVKERRIVKASAASDQRVTFRLIADEWLPRQNFIEDHQVALRNLLDRDLFPYLGDIPVTEIKPALVLEALRKVETRGTLETAAKCRRLASQVFRYAIQTARAEHDPAAVLRGAIKSPVRSHRATIPLKEMPKLFTALEKVPAEAVTKLAIYWLILTAARTGEMRYATWQEIDHGNLWRIPAERMKMQREHVVPLSDQAKEVLRLAKPLRASNDPDALIFPGFTRHGALSENALLALLARAGYFGRQTSHGFRASFSTWAHEVAEADPDVVEACLAHVKEGVRGVYNRATYLSKRLALLQKWADQCSEWGMRPK
jgi:integrase